ncbi:sensor histidine kinase [Flavobacterium sp. MK4S-17]|uniref:tetratricopeptide repeat-containing sensor histidine kinase n=1 Tax=Flavobacterium sp. MK4S-17 TaxID=2543737 RepID=UPI001358CD4A|nr:sensor histidine kinase [Flavobacterium sp. MK4S-17]
MLSVIIKKLLVPACILLAGTVYSQYFPQLLTIENELKAENYDEAQEKLNNIDTTALNKPEKALYCYLKGNILYNNSNEDLAFQQFLIARKLFKEADSLNRAMDLNLKIAYLLQAQENNTINYSKYIKEYVAYVEKLDNPVKLARGYGNLAMFMLDEQDYDLSLKYYHKALNYINRTDNKVIKSAIYNNIANLYNESLHQPDSGLYYLEKDLAIIRESGNDPEYLYHNYLNRASSYYHKKEYDKAIDLLKTADSLPISNLFLKSKQIIYEGLYKNYAAKNDYKNAYESLLAVKQLADSINVTEQNIALNNIETKYRTKEKELENEILKGNIKIGKVLLYTFFGLLIASVVIGFLLVKNSRRKEKILHQEKLIEQQKLEKALKEYELSSIDIMLEGQEKERQRIANDLHDNLGSMLATLKLNFEHLRMRKNDITENEGLYQKTDDLIAEAYQRVRRIAHAKNAGVFANEGLIPALKKLAEKISVPGKLKMDFISFGFNERLENALEITIFRMVQELATNIIKHSQATEASVQLTHHDDNINIIIEDNGVGFPVSKLRKADGMGINTIMRKVEQMEGTFTVDSTPGQGTTIIIDLPV